MPLVVFLRAKDGKVDWRIWLFFFALPDVIKARHVSKSLAGPGGGLANETGLNIWPRKFC